MAKKGCWWKNLLFVFLGIFIGIAGVAVGGVTAGMFITGEHIEKWTKKDDLFTEDFAEKNLISMIISFGTGEANTSTLGGLSKFTPVVDRFVDKLLVKFKENFGYAWDKNELYSRPIDDVVKYVIDDMKQNATIAGLIKCTENSDSVVKALSYPKNPNGGYDYEHPYTLNQFMGGSFMRDLLHSLTVGDLISDPDNSGPLIAKIKDWTLDDLKNDATLKSLKVKDILSPEEIAGSKILTAIQDFELGSLSSEIQNVVLGNFIDVGDNKILKLLENTAIKDLSAEINNITFAQLIDKDDLNGNDALYNYLCNYSIGNLEAAIKDMTIGALVDNDSGVFKYIDKNRPISELADAINELTIVDAFEEHIFEATTTETPREERYMKVVWRFMLTPANSEMTKGKNVLYGQDPNRQAYEQYTVGDSMNVLIDNFTYHVNAEDLQTMSDAGLVTVDADFLVKPIPQLGIIALETHGVQLNGRTLYGQLRVNELTIVLNAVS